MRHVIRVLVGVTVLTATLVSLSSPASAARPRPERPQKPPAPVERPGGVAEVHFSMTSCPTTDCDPNVNPTYTKKVDWVQNGKTPVGQKTSQEGDAPASVATTTAPMELGLDPSQPVDPNAITTAAISGPRCCSAEGSGTINTSTRWCGYANPWVCYTFNTRTNWSWGGGIPGVRWGYVRCCPQTFQWISSISSIGYQDAGPHWGLPAGYFNYAGRGPWSGWYTEKAHRVNVCAINIGCSGSQRPAAHITVRNDGSWYVRTWAQ